jgi:cytochrome c peroxidase
MAKLQGDIGPLPAVPVPADNSQTQDKIELGKMLFFDPRLSGDNKISCSTCHDPSKGFADGKARAIGFGGKELGRHSPTVLNAAYNTAQFWDGRSPSLEDQATKPIEATGEMNLPRQAMAGRLVSIPEYKKQFRELFGEDPTLENVGKAIASFERTIIAPEAPFDRYARGDKQALNPQEKRGLILFMSKAACTQCHNGPNFTDNKFHVLGVPQKGPLAEDMGRYDVTKDEKDKGAFKTPSLRNIALTAPYAHDGAFGTLDEVVEFYNQGGGSVPNKSPKLLKLHLTKQEKSDLVAFLKTLTGTQPVVSIPQLPKEN